MTDLVVDARVLGAAVLGGALGYFISQRAARPRVSHQAVHVLLCEFGFASKLEDIIWKPIAMKGPTEYQKNVRNPF